MVFFFKKSRVFGCNLGVAKFFEGSIQVFQNYFKVYTKIGVFGCIDRFLLYFLGRIRWSQAEQVQIGQRLHSRIPLMRQSLKQFQPH